MTILRAATHETELGDHDFYLSQSHYTDTDPTSRERAAIAENPEPPHQESRALPTEPPCSPPPLVAKIFEVHWSCQNNSIRPAASRTKAFNYYKTFWFRERKLHSREKQS